MEKKEMNEVLPQNKLQPWLICFSAALFFFYLVMQLAVFNTIGTALMHDLKIQSSALSQLSATYLYACAIFFLPAGLLFDRFPTKTLLVIAALLCVLGTALIAMTSVLSVAFIGRILVGISNPFSFLGPMRLVSRWFSAKRAGFIMGLVVTVGMSGGIVAQSPFELLMHAVGGWRNAMLINAALGILITILMMIVIKDNPENEVKTTKNIYSGQINFLQGLKQTCRKKQNWLCGLYTGLLNLPLVILGALWGNLYLVQTKGYSSILAGNLLSLIFIGLIFGPPLIGWSSDKLGLRKPPILFSSICIFLTAMMIIYLNVPLFILAILLFMLGFFSGAQAMSYPLVIESNHPKIESTALGLISTVVNVIGAASQMLLAWLINLHWNGALIHGVPFYTAENFKFALTVLPLGFLLSVLVGLLIQETFNKKIFLATGEVA